jgi:hypothetical protein
MRWALLFLIPLLLAGIPAAEAQSRIYAGVMTAADGGTRGNIPGGAVHSAGGLIGVRLTEAWSIEVEVERGYRTTTAGSGESVIVSFPPTRNPTHEEIELYGIRARSDRTQTAGGGWSALAAWRTRQPGRVNVGFVGGVSSRIYTSHLVRTTTFVSPLVNLSPIYRLPDDDSTRLMVDGGLAGGVLIFVRVTPPLKIAPELRLTTGMITDDPYRVFRSGVRAMWAF